MYKHGRTADKEVRNTEAGKELARSENKFLRAGNKRTRQA